jgi:hypothetical protein
MPSPEQALRALHELGATDVAHLNGNLATHLLGTCDRLRHWGNPEPVCVAGLFHAVYGTYGFGEQLLGLECRADIATIIGQEAEHLVYVYAACDRGFFYPRLRQEDRPSYKDRFCGAVFILEEYLLKGFSEITLANELDVASPNVTEYVEKYGRYVLPLFRSSKFLALLSPGARDECVQCFFPDQT